MDPERKQFLENALKSLTLDVVEKLNDAIKTLQNNDDSSEENHQIEALECIQNYIDDIDTANGMTLFISKIFFISSFC